MNILGLSHPISWNGAACLLQDGVLTYWTEEERLNRIKHAPRMTPRLSVERCLEVAGVEPGDIDVVAVGMEKASRVGIACLKRDGSLLGRIADAALWTARLAQTERRLPLLGSPAKAWHFHNHHLSHAASAFFASGFDEAGIISLDGSGGSESGLLGVGRGDSIEVLQRISNQASWGVFYETFTGLLGFRRHSGEGKLMGLAAYGTPQPDTFRFMSWDGDIPTYSRSALDRYARQIVPRGAKDPITQAHKDLAATVQHVLEQVALRMARWLNVHTGVTRFALAGGTALNCSMNGFLAQQPFVDHIFIQPAAYDAGTALGAAMLSHIRVTGKRPSWKMEHAYWGDSFTNEEIEAALGSARNLRYERSDDVFKATAEHLAAGKIVGWFQGRSEIGPRALGNRSIVADPSQPDMKDRVNLQVKHREPWRPFAPSVKMEHARELLKSELDSPFMIMAFDTPAAWREPLKSAIHVDGTCRPQTVEKNHNERYWRLLDAFEQRTGVRGLLNTSFNVDSQPIVNTPAEAIDTFLNCGIEVLAIGDFIVHKT